MSEPSTLSGKTIVAIDDTPSIRTFLRLSLEDEGAKVHEAATANEGLALCQQLQPDLVVLDLGLPDRDGLEVLPEISQAGQRNVIVLTVRKGQETVQAAHEKGAFAYLNKPFMVEELLEIIEKKLA